MPLTESQLQRMQRMLRDECESEAELHQFLDTATDPEESRYLRTFPLAFPSQHLWCWK